MKKSRIIALFLALVAAAGAFVLATSSRGPAPGPVIAEAPPVATDDILVAAKDLPIGTLVDESALSWQAWPKDSIPAGMIRKSENPKAIEDIKGSIARASMFLGEPIRHEKLVKGASAGLMSAILPSGMRAVAINIDSSGATTAGGFIFPNDRVDVVKTYHEEARSGATPGDRFVSETLLRNVLVRAIGPNIQDKNGQPVVVGSTATLELDPIQAEVVILAQRTGQLSLTLRSMLDAQKTDGARPQSARAMTVVRFGTATEDADR